MLSAVWRRHKEARCSAWLGLAALQCRRAGARYKLSKGFLPIRGCVAVQLCRCKVSQKNNPILAHPGPDVLESSARTHTPAASAKGFATAYAPRPTMRPLWAHTHTHTSTHLRPSPGAQLLRAPDPPTRPPWPVLRHAAPAPWAPLPGCLHHPTHKATGDHERLIIAGKRQ
eukprot:scaffold46813_cov38-Tisochrysis_lutea.AAC.15